MTTGKKTVGAVAIRRLTITDKHLTELRLYQWENIVPMKRAGKPEEVAALAAFLCSDDASYISGQIININGAMA